MAGYKTVEISQAFDNFDDIIDVRSPAEFAHDHIPGAINLPVLNNEERVFIGTMYTQVSSFEAKKHGAALIARNIAHHLDEALHDRQKNWRPLIYCWRGGMRSGAMAHILSQVGWKSTQLAGGYKAYRRHIITALGTLPDTFKFIVICGATGSGKSRLLQALTAQDAQVLDLEKLAQHRGSLLGQLPGQSQPSQKHFETLIWDVLRTFSTNRPIYVEAESRKIGTLSVPEPLMQRMRAAHCVHIEASLEARTALLMEEYDHFLRNPALLAERLSLLVELHGHKILEHWCTLINRSEWNPLLQDLLSRHYDPAYRRSSGENFSRLPTAMTFKLDSLDHKDLKQVATELIQKESLLK